MPEVECAHGLDGECPVCGSRQVVLDRADPLAPHWIGDKLEVCPGSLKPGNFIEPAR